MQVSLAYLDMDAFPLSLTAIGLVVVVTLVLRRWFVALGLLAGGLGVPAFLVWLVLSNPHALQSIH